MKNGSEFVGLSIHRAAGPEEPFQQWLTRDDEEAALRCSVLSAASTREAKFCPECGHDLTAVEKARRRREETPVASRPAKEQTRTAGRAAERREPPTRSGRSRSTAWIWLGVAVAAAVVAIVVVVGGLASGGSGSSSSPPIAADTSGTYSELVARANALYDQGAAAFDKNDVAGGEQYFKAASEVYRAAWTKQPGDPNVGTDFAISLFYMRHHDEALAQIATVLKKSPGFQPAHLNKGIFLRTEASEAKNRGEQAKATEFLTQAKAAFEKAVSIDSNSEAGTRAAEQLQSL